MLQAEVARTRRPPARSMDGSRWPASLRDALDRRIGIRLDTIARLLVPLATLGCMAGCASPDASRRADPQGPPLQVLGEFQDDYGIRYTISEQEWHQHPRSRYRVVRWNARARYLIAQNDPGNPTDPGKWTRIDWIVLPGMSPYEWAFCLSAYSAPSAEAAERADVARRDIPKAGCNGYPFSRMRPVGDRNTPQ